MPARALVVVDVQRDFADAGGSLYVPGGERVAEMIHDELLSPPRYELVVATRDRHVDPGPHFSDEPDFENSWPPHCVAGTPGVEFHPALLGNRGPSFAAVFDKGERSAAYSGFEGRTADGGEELTEFLAARDVSGVDVVGIALDYCVRATALDAQRAGFATRVLLGYTVAVGADSGVAAAAELAAAGVDVQGGRTPVR